MLANFHTSKIRKRWLVSFFVLIAFLYSLDLFVFLYGDHDDSVKSGIEMLVTIPIWGWITFHCSYRKRGTAWLMWILLVQPLLVIKEIVTSLPEDGSVGGLVYFLWAILLAVYGFFWFNCFKYRQENLLLRKFPERIVLIQKNPAKAPLLLAKLLRLLKQMCSDQNPLKRGINRIGMVISLMLSGITFLVGIFCVFSEGFSDLYMTVPFTLLFTTLFFSLPLLLAKGIGWIAEGFQSKAEAVDL